ncbi:phosphatase PAP2 family protein [Streptomyces sp. AK02-01A]|uniref:phosphatase PAP2 family protein n=1 Tax=Streptomyces sp. AK02-01A TaxID=3028648 RepID=UPI0029A79180|nr:phosphatase PAP2 family protein [Streptomyces sp. AK02-01A]MDX3852429.1 phosphatase PAP2 family protein [Streptomyces sp. AK02-01A]
MTPDTLAASHSDGWFDDGVYTYVSELTHRSPGWLDTAISVWSAYGLALFAVFLLASWWRARATDPARTAMALAAPLVVLASFAASDALKALVQERRPCQVLHTATIEACPPPGDWSLPSNHAAIAAAAAVAVLFTDRALAAAAIPAAVLMAVSRVWVGAHYPHDVVLGLLVGAVVAGALMIAARRSAPLVSRLRETRLRPLVASR